MYDFNLLVSCPWTAIGKAKREIASILGLLGDEEPLIRGTTARGITGVRTSLDPRDVIRRLKMIFDTNQSLFQFTFKWVLIDSWTNSDVESMKMALEQLKGKIKQGERWRMIVEKRRYTQYQEIDIIKQLVDFIDEKVDLRNPDKIFRIDIIGKHAGMSVLSPNEIFSTTKFDTVDTAN